MTTHGFTLIAEGVDINEPDVFDALYEAGCDDALVWHHERNSGYRLWP